MLVVLLSIVIFGLIDMAPGSPEQVLLGARPSTPETIAAVRAEYHLDDPLYVRYLRWAGDAARLDFGRSIRTNEPVIEVIKERFLVTLELGIFGFVLTMLIGVPLGMWAAIRQRSSLDRGVVSLSIVGVSAPAFVTGVLLLYILAVRLSLFPVYGQGTGVVGRVNHLTLPALTLALTGIGLVLKLTRTAVIGALDQDYVTFARARGISESRVLYAYALRNALIPIVTAGGLLLAYMLAGAVLVEETFALPGLGSLLVESVEHPRHSDGAGTDAADRNHRRGRQSLYRPSLCADRSTHHLREGADQ